MKKILSGLMVMVMLLTTLTGCTPEGKAFLDLYKTQMDYEVFEQMNESEITIDLNGIMTYMGASLLTNSEDDEKSDAVMERLQEMLRISPKAVFKIQGVSKTDIRDANNIKAQSTFSLSVDVFGETYQQDNIEVIMDNNKIYMSKNYMDFLVELEKGVLKKVVLNVSDVDVDKMINEANIFSDISENYIMIDLNHQGANEALILPISDMMDQDEARKITRGMIDDMKKMDIEIPVTVNNGAYTATLTVEEVMDMLPELLKAFAGFEALVDSKDGLLELAEKVESDDYKTQLNGVKTTFAGTKMSLTLENKSNQFNAIIDFNLTFMGTEFFKMSSKNTAKKVDSVDIKVPAKSDAMDFIAYLEEQNEIAKKEAEASYQAYLNEPHDAVYKDQKVSINGTPMEFSAYNIDGHTFFKLRDLAVGFNATNTPINVTYDNDTQMIKVYTSTSYDKVADGLSRVADKSNKSAYVSQQGVMVDELPQYSEAYNIDGSNYFKLRDFAMMLDFDLKYNEQTQEITIDTTQSYDWEETTN